MAQPTVGGVTPGFLQQQTTVCKLKSPFLLKFLWVTVFMTATESQLGQVDWNHPVGLKLSNNEPPGYACPDTAHFLIP